MLQCCGGRVVDDGVLATLQGEANVECIDQEVSPEIDRIVLQQRRQGLEDLELDVEARRRCLHERLEYLVEAGARQGAGDDKALQADDGDGGELWILGATGDDKGVHKVDPL